MRQQRKQFCIFCNSEISNLRRHFFTKHREEDEIKELLQLPKGSRERSAALCKLRNKGYVLRNKGGEVIMRKGVKCEYVPCLSCGAMFGANTLYRHHQVCSGRGNPKNLTNNTQISERVEVYCNV